MRQGVEKAPRQLKFPRKHFVITLRRCGWQSLLEIEAENSQLYLGQSEAKNFHIALKKQGSVIVVDQFELIRLAETFPCAPHSPP